MQLAQSFAVKNTGHIAGGSVSYTYDDSTAILAYKIDLRTKVLWITHDVPIAGSEHVDAKQLLSTNFTSIGAKLQIGNLALTVTGVTGSRASASFTTGGALGAAMLDISGQYIQIVSLSAHGSYLGLGYDLEVS